MTDQEHLNLPATRGAGEVEGMIFDGEVVEDAPGPSAPPALVHAAATRARRPARAAARHAGYVAAGLVVLWRRRAHARQRAERMMRAAEASGSHEEIRKWREQAEAERKGRHDRRARTVETTLHVVKMIPLIGTIGIAGALALGILLSFKWGVHGFLWPWEFLTSTAVMIADAVTALRLVGPPVAAAGALAVFHEAGRRAGDLAPKWAVTSADADVDVAIDEAAVTQALAALRIPQITEYVKGGVPMPYIVPCRQEGRGTYCEVRLPKGLPAEEIAEKPQRRARLAAGLYRHTKEVWPSTGSDNSVLKLWVADKGALEEGAGPYPLLTEGFTDVFKGLPFGRILKGDPSRITVMGRNTMCGGMPEQGKSTAAKVVAVGYALDVRTELRIYVPDTNFDFERFVPRCSRYEMGAEDEVIERICGELEELKDELQVRGQLLIDAEAEEVTPELAEAGIGLHPMFVLLEEAHVAIQHKKYGKDVSGLLCDIVKLDRKRAVHLFVSTQAPTKDSMPRDVTRNCSNGIAFAVGDHVANDALLGQGAYRGGHRATELIPGTDRGIALCKGFSGERSEMVQVHRIQGRAEQDDITPIVNRSLAEMARLKRAVPGAGRGPLAITYRDLLADLAEVTPEGGKFGLTDLAYRLQRADKSYYRGLDGVKLRRRLEDEGVRTTNPGNRPTLDTADLRAELAQREREVS